MSLTTRGTRAFERAAQQAHGEGSRRITDVHLLSAILETPSSGALMVLRAIGVQPQKVGRGLAAGRDEAPAMLSR
jgi:ATP-dependent Clp protease ATP-binding subunit ClpA